MATRSFGWRSDRPEHGALLDWLAQWVRSGGSFKAMHRLFDFFHLAEKSGKQGRDAEDPINQWFGQICVVVWI